MVKGEQGKVKKEKSEKFDARKHLTKLKHSKKEYRNDGKYEDARGRRFNWVIVESDYLEVKWRLVWFRQGGSGMPAHPEWTIRTTLVKIDSTGGFAIFMAEIIDEGGRLIASGHRTETKADWSDYVEKAETGAVGRALAMAGYGTQFAPELEEEGRETNALEETEEKPISTGKVGEEAIPPAQKEFEKEQQRRIEFLKEIPQADLTTNRSSYILAQDFQHKIAYCTTTKMLEEIGQRIKARKAELKSKDVEMLKKDYSKKLEVLKGGEK